MYNIMNTCQNSAQVVFMKEKTARGYFIQLVVQRQLYIALMWIFIQMCGFLFSCVDFYCGIIIVRGIPVASSRIMMLGNGNQHSFGVK